MICLFFKPPPMLTKSGICPQRNVLWDELTVDEHVRIWNDIKSCREDEVALPRLVDACDLTVKKGARAGTLSGGQKRKLQLACMFVGGSTICLLDEVTSGLVRLTIIITIHSLICKNRIRSRAALSGTSFLPSGPGEA